MNEFEALAILARQKPTTTLDRLYEIPEVGSACVKAFEIKNGEGFEYPDHSWKKMSAVLEDACRRASPAARLWAGLLAGHPGIVEGALLAGASANSRYPGKDGPTLLCKAASLGYNKMCDALCSLGADANEPDLRGCPPMAYALLSSSDASSAAVMKTLKKHGAEPSHAIDTMGNTPLHAAARLGKAHAVSLLLSLGALADAINDHGETPLHCAAERNRPECASLLIGKGADKEARAAHGRTPLHYAAASGSPKALLKLISLGSDIEARTDEGETPVMVAAAMDSKSCFERLLRAGVSMSATDDSGRSPSDWIKPSSRIAKFMSRSHDRSVTQ